MGSIVQMVAVSTGGTESALAAVDVPQDGMITGVEWACFVDFDTDNDSQVWQISFASTVQNANDSRAIVSNCSMGQCTFSAGQAVIGVASYYAQLPDIPVAAGERLFLHSTAAAGVVGTARATVHFSFEEARPAARRR